MGERGTQPPEPKDCLCAFGFDALERVALVADQDRSRQRGCDALELLRPFGGDFVGHDQDLGERVDLARARLDHLRGQRQVVACFACPHPQRNGRRDDDDALRADKARGFERGSGLARTHTAKAPGELAGCEERGVFDLVR